ncbi:tRNA(adenine34) deaminase [Mucor velutinosus]|uniref:tRNA(Adenine34) deaminase n=1 Tax=Mucor velutinosus TaxID=708070 RepID=A0AAN7HUB6_9FUNG|nr:hypothetical protein ATC70_001083 [Mucor velutinosus]KAK4517743.1 hypothetical protein ATC70_001085 [Mucor velutinosus]KAK4517745.1 tRNA(adenine34) deaminase [Mucor velutinosus]
MKFLGSILAATFVAVSTAFPASVHNSLNTIHGNNGDASTTPFYVTAPLENTTYTAPSIVTTTWLNGIDEQFTIAVLEGKDPASMKPIGLNLTANGKTGTYVWTVPKELVGGTYAFQYIFDLYGITSATYSNQFKVIGNGSANTSATTVAPASII